MLASPQTLTYNAESITLNRINQDNFSSKFFGKGVTNIVHPTLGIQHTIPKKADGTGESHMVRLDVPSVDGTGKYARTTSVWLVIRTQDNVQEDTDALRAASALIAWLTASSNANLSALLARRS